MKHPKITSVILLMPLFINACSSSEKKVETFREQTTVAASPPHRLRGEGVPLVTAERYFTEGEAIMNGAASIAALAAVGYVYGMTVTPSFRYPLGIRRLKRFSFPRRVYHRPVIAA